MLRSTAFSAAHSRGVFPVVSESQSTRNARSRRSRATAVAAMAKDEDDGDVGVGTRRPQAADDAEASPSPSVSRRAALALSLASTAASFLEKPSSAAAAAAPGQPSTVDPFADGGTVTLLRVRGDGRDQLSLSEAVVLDTNRKVHSANGAPEDFPGFVRVGFDIKVVVPIEDEEEQGAGSGDGGATEGDGGATEGDGGAGSGEGGGGGEERQQQENAAPEEASSSSAPATTTEASPSPSSPGAAATAVGYQITPEGLIYKDYAVGVGPLPAEGQEVVFDYVAYNESGGRIDSSYLKGRPASARIGVGAGGGLIPGFELGLVGMRAGGRRRLIVPPALGPPVGPQTFFSAKQCEVFDVQLRSVKSCRRRQVAMFSDVVCE